jgi:hypothetical protein
MHGDWRCGGWDEDTCAVCPAQVLGPAYAHAMRAIDRLPPPGAERLTDSKTVLRKLVDTLNRIDQEHKLIDSALPTSRCPTWRPSLPSLLP